MRNAGRGLTSQPGLQHSSRVSQEDPQDAIKGRARTRRLDLHPCVSDVRAPRMTLQATPVLGQARGRSVPCEKGERSIPSVSGEPTEHQSEAPTNGL